MEPHVSLSRTQSRGRRRWTQDFAAHKATDRKPKYGSGDLQGLSNQQPLHDGEATDIEVKQAYDGHVLDERDSPKSSQCCHRLVGEDKHLMGRLDVDLESGAVRIPANLQAAALAAVGSPLASITMASRQIGEAASVAAVENNLLTHGALHSMHSMHSVPSVNSHQSHRSRNSHKDVNETKSEVTNPSSVVSANIAQASGNGGSIIPRMTMSSEASSKSPEEILQALSKARKECRQLQRRLRLPAVACLSLLVMALIVHPLSLVAEKQLPPGVEAVLGMALPFTAMTMTLLVLPTDVPSVRLLNGLLCCCLMSFGTTSMPMVITAIQDAFASRCPEGDIIDGSHGFLHFQLAGDTGCWVRYSHFFIVLAGCVLSYVSAVYLLFAFRLPPRGTLNRQWYTIGLACILYSVLEISMVSVLFVHELLHFHGSARHLPELSVDLFASILRLVTGIYVRRPHVRARVQGWLSSRRGDITAASGIAAFIGNNKAEQVNRKAQEMCCYVTLDRVTEKDMRKQTPDPSLRNFASPCHLGEIDAFLSHSWHDPPAAKWKELQRWRQQFKQSFKREPRVWIDKYCIDQTDIESSLMCLPVFLAGCQSMVILAGPTYLSRLWCVEEIFIFMIMGRDPEALQLRLLASTNEEADEIVAGIHGFDVANATTSLDKDREALMAAIEVGCQGFAAFNEQVISALTTAHTLASESHCAPVFGPTWSITGITGISSLLCHANYGREHVHHDNQALINRITVLESRLSHLEGPCGEVAHLRKSLERANDNIEELKEMLREVLAATSASRVLESRGLGLGPHELVWSGDDSNCADCLEFRPSREESDVIKDGRGPPHYGAFDQVAPMSSHQKPLVCM